MPSLEANMSTSWETKASKEATEPQCFDSTYKGKNITLSNDSQTAERIWRQNDCICYEGVISKFPLKEEEVFQFIIEETNDIYWDYSGIALGVITDKKAEVEGVLSISNNTKGTWAIRSWCGSPEGKSDIYKDNFVTNTNAYLLDTRNLKVGTVIGVKLCRNGNVRFLLNGLDRGVAFRNVPNNVFACIEIANYVTKIRIVY